MKVEVNTQSFAQIPTGELFIKAKSFNHDKVRSCTVLQKKGPKTASSLSSPNSPPIRYLEKDDPVIPVSL